MECPVNKEIRNYREGVFMGLSMRQTIWGFVALVVAGAANFGLRPFIGKETASVLCILLAALPAAVGFMSYHGLNFEQIARAWLRTMFRHNGWYVYRAVCLYDTLHCAAIKERQRATKTRKKTYGKGAEKQCSKEKNSLKRSRLSGRCACRAACSRSYRCSAFIRTQSGR